MPNGKDSYREVLKQARVDRARLLKQLDKLHNVIQYVEEYLGEPSQESLTTSISKQDSALVSRRFEDMTARDAAVVVIRESGDWLHLDTIVTRIIDGGKKFSKVELKRSLYTTLMRTENIVRHPEKGATFGLSEWLERDNLEATERTTWKRPAKKAEVVS